MNGDSFPEEINPLTLVQILQQTASSSSHGCHYIGLSEVESFQSYDSLQKNAMIIAGGLARAGACPGDPVVLQALSPADFLASFWGCVVGGFVAVPLTVVVPSHASSLPSRRLCYSNECLDSPLILTSEELLPGLGQILQNQSKKKARLVSLEEIKARPQEISNHSPSLNDRAAILLTSGSTGNPKFVSLSHLNFFSSIAGAAFHHQLNSNDISLNWLPFHHVSALMRAIRDVYVGCNQLQGTYSDALANPLQWIDWMDRYKVTTTWAPNFAFALVTGYRNRLSGARWNLDAVRFIVATGEPIVQKTIEDFAEMLQPFGLRQDALNVSWGMTESCFSSCSDGSHRKVSVRRFAPVGRPVRGVSIRIVDASDQPVLEGVEGNLQIRGAIVANEYVGEEKRTAGAFTGDGWFRTGDLGIIQDGVLEITGREKDLILIHGVKYSILEVEAIVESIEGILPRSVAVCIVRDPQSATEGFALFFQPAEPDERVIPDLIRRIRAEVQRKMGIVPNQIIPIDHSHLPRTSSGKLLRSELRQLLESGAFQQILDSVDRSMASSGQIVSGPLERTIAAFFCEVLNLKEVQARDNFFELGGNSIQVIQLASRLTTIFSPRQCLPVDIATYPTVQQLAVFLSGTVEQKNAVSNGMKRAEFRKSRAGRHISQESTG